MELANHHMPHTWKGIKNVEMAKQLIDYGILLTWRDMKQLPKVFSLADRQMILRHFALRLGERVNDRLAAEILMESLLVWLAQGTSEIELNSFLSELLLQPNYFEACTALVEIAVTAEVSDLSHGEDIISMAVCLICELGKVIQKIHDEQPDSLPEADKMMQHISTFLLSVSNSNNNVIRLSLINYFGVTEAHLNHKPGFNRILGRFGHTVLEHLFSALFNKKTESVALQYMLDNLPFFLEADPGNQRIIFETFKFYMLKKPERFMLFVHMIARQFHSVAPDELRTAQKVFLQHLAMLLKVASEVNHKDLGRELITAIGGSRPSRDKDEIVALILNDKTIRPAFQDVLRKTHVGQQASGSASAQEDTSSSAFRSSKRGRKPSFTKTSTLRTIEQVSFLGTQNIAS